MVTRPLGVPMLTDDGRNPMDPMQLLAIVAVVLAIVLVGLTLVVVSMVRNQQQAQK